MMLAQADENLKRLIFEAPRLRASGVSKMMQWLANCKQSLKTHSRVSKGIVELVW